MNKPFLDNPIKINKIIKRNNFISLLLIVLTLLISVLLLIFFLNRDNYIYILLISLFLICIPSYLFASYLFLFVNKRYIQILIKNEELNKKDNVSLIFIKTIKEDVFINSLTYNIYLFKDDKNIYEFKMLSNNYIFIKDKEYQLGLYNNEILEYEEK